MSASLDAEMALVGAALSDNRIVERVTLAGEHFFDPVLGDMWDEITARVRAGRAVDGLSLREWFKARAPELPLTFLLDISNTHLLTVHALEYGDIIRDAATRRRTTAMLRESLARADAGEPLLEVLAGVEASLRAIAGDGKAAGADLADASGRFLERIDETGAEIGLKALDARLGGLYRGELTILAGRPSMGKTALAAQIARNVASRGRVVHFASLEMSKEQLARRAISAASFVRQYGSERVEYHHLRNGAPNIDRDLLRELGGSLPRTFWVDDRPALTLAQLEEAARATRGRWKRLDLIVVDYLQLMTSRRSDGRVNEITEISQGLKAIAKRLDAPVVALSQLSRAVEGRDNKRPTLSDLRDSGAIEQDADVVLAAYREAYYLERAEPTDPTAWKSWRAELDRVEHDLEVITLKQRQGPIGSDLLDAWLSFDTVRDRLRAA